MFLAECFSLLAVGGTVVMHPENLTTSVELAANRLRQYDISVWNSVPMQLHSVVDHAERESMVFPSIRQMTLGGDWAVPSLLRRATVVFPNARMHVLGGATEASIHSTWHSVVADDLAGVGVPYGLAMAGQATYILDSELRPVPPGEQGELYLAGIGLAWGYLDDPRLTAERFLPDASGRAIGARAYATGDLVREVAGELMLSGRADNQVQVGGFRVEPREVEAVLEVHPAVRRAVVVGLPADVGTHGLVAAVETSEDVDEPALRALVADNLPGPMVPQRVIAIAAMPVNHNGKVDRIALAALLFKRVAEGASAADSGAESHAKDTDEEVAAAYAGVLGHAIGRDEALIDSGGASMTAMLVQREIERRLGVRPALRVVLLEPISSVASQVRMLRHAGG